jgi:hypothetical protein
MAESRNHFPWVAAVMTVASVGGGCGGIVSCLLMLLGIAEPSIKQVVGILLITSIYFLGVTSGLLQHVDPRRSFRLFKIYLITQIPITKSFLFSYKLFSLASCSIVLHPKSSNLDFGWQLGSDWELSVFHPAVDSGIGINIVPLFLWIFLRRFLSRHGQLNQNATEQANSNSASLGRLN